jgi:hypothetical protein
MNLDGMLKGRLNDLGPIRVCGTIMVLAGCHTHPHRHLHANPLIIICLIMLWFSPRPDKNLRSFHLHIITPHTISTAVRPLPVSNVECQIVPRTGHDKALHTPFTQRTAFMGTTIMDRKIRPLDVEERNLPIVHRDDF